MSRFVSLALCLVLCLVVVGCECAPSEPADADRVAGSQALYVDPATVDFGANPSLLLRLRENPHNYFRFVRAPFATEVCRLFSSEGTRAPRVNLHGDAHLEQYAVTDLGRGLTDFDGATEGPAVLDLVRMGASVRIACEMQGWQDQQGQLTDALFAGYRRGIAETGQHAPPEEPRIVAAIRRGFSTDRARLLRETESLAQPLSAEDTAAAQRALATYVAAQLEDDPTLPSGFFDLVSIRRLDMGIGSALDEKYLLRVRGPTDLPEDDEILEAKEVLSIAEIPCVGSDSDEPDPFRILVAQSRIAYQPFPYLGYVRVRRKVFWIHGWTANYREVSVTDSLNSTAEFEELVADIGFQLGRGHVNRIAAPLDGQLRRAMLEYLDEQESTIRDAIAELSRASRAAWERFVRATEDHPALTAPRSSQPSVFSGDP